jgi:opacity protein-like surface antigen
MRKADFFVFAWWLMVPLAFSQAPTRANIFLGYSFSNVNAFNFDQGRHLYLHGWEGSFEVKVVRWVGFVADVDEHSGSPCRKGVITCYPGNTNVSQSDLLFGPRASMHFGPVRPFVQALFGFEHVATNTFGPDKSLAYALGGGLDYTIARHVAWRFQGDYMRTTLFTTTQNNGRLSTGIVVRF